MWERQRKYLASYISDSFIEAVQRYEQVIQTSIRDIVNQKKLTVYKGANDALKVQSFSALLLGSNKNCAIDFIILRAVSFKTLTFLLVAESLTNINPNNYYCLVVLCHKSLNEKWINEIGLSIKLRVKQPYLEGQLSNEMQICVTRVENVIVQSTKKWKADFEEVKNKGNLCFNVKQYYSALMYYEFALACCFELNQKKNRSILYGNAAACLNGMRLYDSAIKYASISIRIDSAYAKAYSRKIHSLLEMKQFKQIPCLLINVSKTVDAQTLHLLNKKYTNYLMNSLGMYNWIQIFSSSQNSHFCEYKSSKIEQRVDAGVTRFYAKETIESNQLLLLSKPIFYTSKNNGSDFLQQIEKFVTLQKSFKKAIENLPQFKANENIKCSENDILKQKIKQFCIQEEELGKSECQDPRNGVWLDFAKFAQECESNCSYIHVKTALCVSASKKIYKGSALSLDYAAYINTKERKQFLFNKFHIDCQCRVCEWKKWPQNFSDFMEVVEIVKQLDSIKMLKQMMWEMIHDKDLFEKYYGSQMLYEDVLEKFTKLIEMETKWEDILRLLKLIGGNAYATCLPFLKQVISSRLNKLLSMQPKQCSTFIDLLF